MDFDHKIIEKKWQKIWDEKQSFYCDVYDFSKPNREIIVYKTIDTRLLFSDMESRFRLATR